MSSRGGFVPSSLPAPPPCPEEVCMWMADYNSQGALRGSAGWALWGKAVRHAGSCSPGASWPSVMVAHGFPLGSLWAPCGAVGARRRRVKVINKDLKLIFTVL